MPSTLRKYLSWETSPVSSNFYGSGRLGKYAKKITAKTNARILSDLFPDDSGKWKDPRMENWRLEDLPDSHFVNAFVGYGSGYRAEYDRIFEGGWRTENFLLTVSTATATMRFDSRGFWPGIGNGSCSGFGKHSKIVSETPSASAVAGFENGHPVLSPVLASALSDVCESEGDFFIATAVVRIAVACWRFKSVSEKNFRDFWEFAHVSRVSNAGRGILSMKGFSEKALDEAYAVSSRPKAWFDGKASSAAKEFSETFPKCLSAFFGEPVSEDEAFELLRLSEFAVSVLADSFGKRVVGSVPAVWKSRVGSASWTDALASFVWEKHSPFGGMAAKAEAFFNDVIRRSWTVGSKLGNIVSKTATELHSAEALSSISEVAWIKFSKWEDVQAAVRSEQYRKESAPGGFVGLLSAGKTESPETAFKELLSLQWKTVKAGVRVNPVDKVVEVRFEKGPELKIGYSDIFIENAYSASSSQSNGNWVEYVGPSSGFKVSGIRSEGWAVRIVLSNDDFLFWKRERFSKKPA